MNTDEYLFFSNLPFTNPVRPKKPELIEQLLQIIKDEQPDIIQVDFIDNADIGSVLPKNIPSVLVLHDLRFSGVAQSAKLLGLKDKYADYLKEYVRTIEVNFIKLFDAAITFSEDDKNSIKMIDPKINVTAIPFAVPDKNITSSESANAINKIIFIGPEHHHANYDAIRWYESEIQPEIWDKHKIKLSVIGKWSEKTIKKFSKNGIEFLGFVDDLKEVLKSSAMIVPIRIGSGIRTKILDAFAFGVPVISTTVGCQGLGTEDGKDILIANSAEEFSVAVSKISKDKTLAAKLIKNARQIVVTDFSQSKVYEQRMELFNRLLTQRSEVFISSLVDN